MWTVVRCCQVPLGPRLERFNPLCSLGAPTQAESTSCRVATLKYFPAYLQLTPLDTNIIIILLRLLLFLLLFSAVTTNEYNSYQILTKANTDLSLKNTTVAMSLKHSNILKSLFNQSPSYTCKHI